MATQPLMKDGLGERAVLRMTHGLLDAGADFCEESFIQDAMEGLETLELKQRVHHLIEVMAKHLPDDFQTTAAILGRIRQNWDNGNPDDNLRSFAAWPIVDYVSIYGIQDPKTALPLLRYLTPMFSAEFAVRPFLNQHPDTTYHEMMLWCLDSDEHVRRLASEGIRPRLPWGTQLTQFIDDPAPVISLLNNLIDDPSDYVRRSVANNLNDISKDHPKLTIETCQRWLSDKVEARQWIIRRATRTLVKAGNPKVFPLLGYTRNPQLQPLSIELSSRQIKLGESLKMSVKIISQSDNNQSMVLDYAIHFVKANGQTAAKVFKWKNLQLKPRQSVQLEKFHTIKPITTRTYYPGTHSIELLINGKAKCHIPFDLTISH